MKYSAPVIFGEVLFDFFPDGSQVLGGAPFNVAWHCQAFGLQPLFISRVGDDAPGDEIRSAMLNWGMDTSGLQQDTNHPTGMVKVSFNAGEPSYEIIENSAWDFIEREAIPKIDEHSILYHGSLAMRNSHNSLCLEKLKRTHPKSVFIDVNLRDPWWNLPLIQNIMQESRWLKLNADELEIIVPSEQGTEARARYLLSHFDIEFIIVTLGAAGAMAMTQSKTYDVQPDKTNNIVDTVGAGDAFCSVLLLGLYKDWPIQDILIRAQQFASAIVGQQGATTQDKSFYANFINDWGL